MLNRKKLLVAASIAGIMAASSSVAMAGSSFPGHDSGNKSCPGMNGCRGMASCKGGKHSCPGKHSCAGGQNGCSGKGAAAKVEDGKLTG